MNIEKISFSSAILVCATLPLANAAPPPAPNFCAYGICLEVSQLGGKAVEVQATIINARFEILIRNPSGVSKVAYSLGDNGVCTQSKSIELEKDGHGYSGSGCVILPGQKVGGRLIMLEYNPYSNETKEILSYNMPVLAIWGVDTSPQSFWESGYALRIGESIKIKWKE